MKALRIQFSYCNDTTFALCEIVRFTARTRFSFQSVIVYPINVAHPEIHLHGNLFTAAGPSAGAFGLVWHDCLVSGIKKATRDFSLMACTVYLFKYIVPEKAMVFKWTYVDFAIFFSAMTASTALSASR